MDALFGVSAEIEALAEWLREKEKGNFLAWFKKKADARNTKWQNVYKHFETFCEGKCTFGGIDVDLCNKFKEYLYTAPQTIHKKQRLHTNTIAGYWSTFRAVLHTAYRDHKIKENPNGFLDRIDTIPTEKEHLVFRPQLHNDFQQSISLADVALDSKNLVHYLALDCIIRQSKVYELQTLILRRA
jgi:hypothetical protein